MDAYSGHPFYITILHFRRVDVHLWKNESVCEERMHQYK